MINPVTGLPAKSNWLPTVKEVFDACDELYDRIKGGFEREARIKEQFALFAVAHARAVRAHRIVAGVEARIAPVAAAPAHPYVAGNADENSEG